MTARMEKRLFFFFTSYSIKASAATENIQINPKRRQWCRKVKLFALKKGFKVQCLFFFEIFSSKTLVSPKKFRYTHEPFKCIKASKKLFFDVLAPAFLPVATLEQKSHRKSLLKLNFFSKDECPFPLGKLLVEQNRWYSHNSKIKKCAERQNTLGRWRHWYCSSITTPR